MCQHALFSITIKQGILSPNYTTETNRRFYTDKEVEKLELILLLKEIGCTIKEIKVLLKDDSSMKSLYTFLQIKSMKYNSQ